MKKRAATTRGSAKKRISFSKTVPEYLAKVPEPARSTLNKVRNVIRSVVPKETTEVISYGIPAFRHKKVIVWYAAFVTHCSVVPTASMIAKFKDELEGYKISKGTIQFPTDKPMPAALIKRIVKARLSEIEG